MRYEASHEVFVAMPFSASFRSAFDAVIEPAVKRVNVAGVPLTARIINRATSGSPDIHEKIFDAIIHSRLVIADMTVLATCVGDDGSIRWQANSNVAYEVGLAAAWRNPEDILLIHQAHPSHAYSFDVQNLRHVQYDLNDATSVAFLVDEIVRAINQSSFLGRQAYLKILQSVSPSAIQYLHQEARRTFPAISFKGDGMPIMDARIHAATELLGVGALKNRNVISKGLGKGVDVVYQWTELGLRMLQSFNAVTPQRVAEMRAQIASVPDEVLPPQGFLDFPPSPPEPASSNVMTKAPDESTVDTPPEATTE
jgi:hypothetical protein